MTRDEIRDWRARLGLSQAQAAAELNVPKRTYLNWDQGARAIPPTVDKLCQMIEEQRKAS